MFFHLFGSKFVCLNFNKLLQDSIFCAIIFSNMKEFYVLPGWADQNNKENKNGNSEKVFETVFY